MENSNPNDGCGFLVFTILITLGSFCFWGTFDDHSERSYRYTSLFLADLASDSIAENGTLGIAGNYLNTSQESPLLEYGRNRWNGFVESEGPATSIMPGLPYIDHAIGPLWKLRGEQILVSQIFCAICIGLYLLGILILAFRFRSDVGVGYAILLILILALDYKVQMAFFHPAEDGLLTALVLLGFNFIWISASRPEGSNRHYTCLAIAGLLFGLTTLFRPQFSVMLLLISILVIPASIVKGMFQKSLLNHLEQLAILLLAFLVVAGPFWLRNCQLNQSFCPLGNTISNQIAGGYPPLSNSGNMDLDALLSSRVGKLSSTAAEERLGADQSFGTMSMNDTLAFYRDSPSEAFSLVMRKAATYVGIGSPDEDGRVFTIINGVLLFAGILGLLIDRKRYGLAPLLVIGISLLVTSLTWTDHGRLFLLFRPLLILGIVLLIERGLRGKIQFTFLEQRQASVAEKKPVVDPLA